jgi:hypothetical protein
MTALTSRVSAAPRPAFGRDSKGFVLRRARDDPDRVKALFKLSMASNP